MIEQEHQPVTLSVYNELKNKIVSLELMPGQILMVQQLSKDFGISRTPVREAVVRLRDDGLVEESDGRKFRVSEITWRMIDDIYETRQALEGLVVSRLAESLVPEQIERLDSLLGQMRQAVGQGDLARYFELDDEFHGALLRIHDNRVILSCIGRIKDQQQRIRFLTEGARDRTEESLAEHERILQSLRAHDGAGASEQMRLHLQLAREDIKNLLMTRYPRPMVKD